MSDPRTGNELTPRPDDGLSAQDTTQQVTPLPSGEQLGVERFSAGPRAHSVALTEERAAQVVRQSGNARNVAFLAVLLIAIFIPVYWFYDLGIPALGAQGRMAQNIEVQTVTDVARGYALFIANCAKCHGVQGQGGIGPPLNDQDKLYNAVQANGQPGTGHLNPTYVQHVLEVGGRYVCGDPNSVMPVWAQPGGPLNYRQIQELVSWITASNEITFQYTPATSETSAGPKPTPVTVSGWRDPNYKPPPGQPTPPACWRNPSGVIGGSSGPAASAAPIDKAGTPDNPRVIELVETASLQITGQVRHAGDGHRRQGRRDGPVPGHQHGRLRPQLLHRPGGRPVGQQHRQPGGHPALLERHQDLHLDGAGQGRQRQHGRPPVRVLIAWSLPDDARPVRHPVGERFVAQQALPPGAVRRRAMFGLLDADGWGYATMKAGWWFLFIIFMLGYIPNLAYYFTVSNTVKVGYNFLSVVNWCPNSNATLPCPAPIGAVVPWQTSPPELALPAGLSGAVAVPSGTHLYLVGGRTAAGVTADVQADGRLRDRATSRRGRRDRRFPRPAPTRPSRRWAACPTSSAGWMPTESPPTRSTWAPSTTAV